MELPAYQQLVERYNANLDGLDRMWSSAVVDIRWTDEDGKTHSHQGDGKLMVVLPDRLALAISKVEIIFWTGCDQERYWLLDLRGKRKDRKAYVGRHELLGASTSARELPLPIHPRQLPWLLGLVQLAVPLSTEAAPRVEYEGGAFVIEPPEINARISVDPVTFLPTAVALLDADDQVVVASTLADVGRVERGQSVRTTWPRIRSRIELRLPDDAGWLTLHLDSMTDARAPKHKRKDKAFGTAFDFELLARSYVDEVVDLDEPAPQDD